MNRHHNARYENGLNLWEAANTGRTAKLKAILEAGNVDVDFTDCDPMQRTPLIEAAKYGHPECVRLLLAHGANPNASSMLGTADTYTNNEAILKMLSDARRGKGPSEASVPASAKRNSQTTAPSHSSTNADKDSKRSKNTAEKGSCCVCGTVPATPLRCSACKSVNYCGLECQRKDWPHHRPNCSPPPLEASDAAVTAQTRSVPVVSTAGANTTARSCPVSNAQANKRTNLGGFTGAQTNLLLSYGVKPYDDDAEDFLEAIGQHGIVADDSYGLDDSDEDGYDESAYDWMRSPPPIPHQHTIEQVHALPHSTLPRVLMFTFEEPGHLESEFYVPFLRVVNASCHLITVSNLALAKRLLSPPEPRPHAILLVGPGILNATYRDVAALILQYCRSGGSAVFGGSMPSDAAPPALNSFFQLPMCAPLQWRYGTYLRENFIVNFESHFAKRAKSLGIDIPQQYNMKAVHIKGISDAECAYGRNGSAPAVLSKFGSGYLGWVGDVNSEPNAAIVTLVMCGVKPVIPNHGKK